VTKLNQIVAIERTAKAGANAAITSIYHVVQKPGLFEGVARTYEPRDDDGERLPAESTRVQYRAADLLSGELQRAWTRLLDLVLTKDTANAAAKADIKINGVTLVAAVPVTYLIWLEKQLTDLTTVIAKLPTLDNAFAWDVNTDGDWATPVVRTARTKKVPRNHVKAEATDKHPAQVEMWYEDVQVGTWNTIRISGAMPAAVQRELLARVATLQEAVKMAREEANNHEVSDQHIGDALFSFLLARVPPA
jgi:hypothetical protein